MRITRQEFDIEGNQYTLERDGLDIHLGGAFDDEKYDQVVQVLDRVFDALSAILLAEESQCGQGEVEYREGGDAGGPHEHRVLEPLSTVRLPSQTVPDISEANRAKLTQMVEELNTLSSALKAPTPQAEPPAPSTGFEFTPTPQDPKPEPEEPKEDPLAQWYAKSNGPKGTMTRREARSQVQWEPGMTYRGSKETIIQCGVDDSPSNPHGAMWTLTLANGDVVTTDLFGKELMYEVADNDIGSPEPEKAQDAIEDAPTTPSLEALEIPPEISKTVKGNRVFAWLIDTVPELAHNATAIVEWCVAHPELNAFKGMDESKIRRRVETVLPSLLAQV